MNAPASAAAVAPDKAAGQFAFHPRLELERWPGNPRQHFDEARLQELARSLSSGHGMIEPIVARPHPKHAGKLEIAAGERRWRAAGIAKLDLVPVIVRKLDDKQMLELATIENAQREDLHPLEQADGYERLIKDFAYTPEKIADAIGKSRAHVFQIRKLRALAPKLREAFLAGEMDTTLATVVARVPSKELQEEAWRELKRQHRDGFSFRVAADFVRKNYMLDLGRAPFAIADATLVPAAGACNVCPKRTGNQPDLFADVKNGNVCTDPACFDAKRKAAQAREIKAEETKGRELILGAEAKKVMPYHGGYVDERSGFVRPDEQTYVGGKWQRWDSLAKQAGVQPALIQVPESGDLKPILRKAQIEKALAAKGIKLGLSRHGGAGDNAMKRRAAEEKNRLENQARRLIHAAIRANVRKADVLAPPVLELLVASFWRHIWHEYRKKLAELWEWKDGRGSPDNIAARLKGLDAGKLARMLVDCALIDASTAGTWQDAGAAKLAAAAKRWRVQEGKIRAAVKKEAQLKKAAKAAAAKKKARQAPGKVKVKKAAAGGKK